jgi:hypothetical protein
MSVSAVYCYVGEQLPEHLFDSLYQTFHVNYFYNVTCYLITNKKWEKYIIDKIESFEKKLDLKIIFSEDLEDNILFEKYMDIANNFQNIYKDFRNGFWIYTTTRFLYISAFMEKYNINNVFHIESDVILYENLCETKYNLEKLNMNDKIVAVQDAINRAVCSIVFFPTVKTSVKYSEYLISCINDFYKSYGFNGKFLNDMDLMGMYNDKYHFPDSPFDTQAKESDTYLLNKRLNLLGCYDANGIGQYLGGIDFRNIDEKKIVNKYINPTKGFINETATFKPDTSTFKKIYTKYGKRYLIGDEKNDYNLNVIHVHSKQLYLYSSLFDIDYTDLITGDRIIELCDFVITNLNQYLYNKNLNNYSKNIFFIKDFNNINVEKMNSSIDLYANQDYNKIIKLFVFIDLMDDFKNFILPKLNDKYKYILYSHNGDYSFDEKYIDIVNDPKIKLVYAQNLNLISPKLKVLPIGIARDMFPHGNLEILYEYMTTTYKNKKTKNIYVNINDNTHPIRKEIMKKIKMNNLNWEISEGGLSYKEYLNELSKHRFCLCIRGNGLDTHRFWESLYLGVIPVVYECEELNNMLNYLKQENIPFIVINEQILYKGSRYFDEKLKNNVLNDNIFCLKGLKLNNYI